MAEAQNLVLVLSLVFLLTFTLSFILYVSAVIHVVFKPKREIKRTS
jgi:hypothetical protein